VLSRLDMAGIWYCVEGGWGVDALLGEQTPKHGDLDLGVRAEEVDPLCSALGEFTRDDAEWPSSVVLTDPRGRRVDAHPLAFDDAGDGWQANARGGEPYCWPGEHVDARGRITGREVRCISPELQLRWHEHEDSTTSIGPTWAPSPAASACPRLGHAPASSRRDALGTRSRSLVTKSEPRASGPAARVAR
jgi:lincosamide nucleotidyltransferase A/C/D/E